MKSQILRFGFVRADYDPITKRLIYSEYADTFLHIIHLESQNLYICTGLTAFGFEKIPTVYKQREFTEFYMEQPPKISNNTNNAVNELILSV